MNVQLEKRKSDILLVGLVGLLWEMALSDHAKLITVVLFALLVISSIARLTRNRDISVICIVGLIWEIVFFAARRWVTILLFALPLFRLLADTLSTRPDADTGGAQRIDWNSISPQRLRHQLRAGRLQLSRRIRTKAFIAELVTNIGILGLGVGALVYLRLGLGISRQIIGYGALSFALGAVGLKGFFYWGLMASFLHKRLAPPYLAITQGFVSALSELGAAALFFWRVVPELSIRELIAFGAAAGIIEAIVIPLMSISGIGILSGTPVANSCTESKVEAENVPLADMVLAIVERALGIWLHIVSRALIYAAMILGNVVLALLSVLFFASVDGLAYYALLKKLLSLNVALKFYIFVALGTGVLTLVFWWIHSLL